MPQTVAEAHGSLPLLSTSSARTKPSGRWGHRNTAPSPPPPPPSITSPKSSEVPTSSYHDPSFFSSSDEADSDSPFPNSSDSEPETPDATSCQQLTTSASISKQAELVSNRRGGESSDCTKLNEMTSLACKSEQDKLEIKPEVPEGWTGAEVTNFRMLHPVFGHNYCTMAEMIPTKTCRQLYDYGKTVSAELLQHHGESNEMQQLVSKKKKKTMRLVCYVP